MILRSLIFATTISFVSPAAFAELPIYAAVLDSSRSCGSDLNRSIDLAILELEKEGYNLKRISLKESMLLNVNSIFLAFEVSAISANTRSSDLGCAVAINARWGWNVAGEGFPDPMSGLKTDSLILFSYTPVLMLVGADNSFEYYTDEFRSHLRLLLEAPQQVTK